MEEDKGRKVMGVILNVFYVIGSEVFSNEVVDCSAILLEFVMCCFFFDCKYPDSNMSLSKGLGLSKTWKSCFLSGFRCRQWQ